MSRHVFVRSARPAEVNQFIEWSRNTPNNLFDPEVALYPSSLTRCAFDGAGPIVYVPFQRPIFIESLAINPEASEMRISAGLKALTQDAVSWAYQQGSGEVYFVCRDESTIKLATHHGYKEMPYRVYRMKLSELEKQNELETTKNI